MNRHSFFTFSFELVIFIICMFFYSLFWYVGDDGRVFLTCNFIFCWLVSYQRSKLLLEYYTHILTAGIFYLGMSIIVSLTLRHPHLFFISSCAGVSWIFLMMAFKYIQLRLLSHPYQILVHSDLIDGLPETKKVNLVSVKNVMPDHLAKMHGVIVDSHYEYSEDWRKLILHAGLSPIAIISVNDYVEAIEQRLPLIQLSENWLYAGFSIPVWYRVLKSILDVLLAIIILPLLLLIFLVICVLILVTMGRPIFFNQKRVGLNGKEFKIYKFRSMRTCSENEGAQFAEGKDPRITKFGRFMRASRIDELPQFINILKGEMSLIGPRPEQKFFVDIFSKEVPLYSMRHMIKPGITGWAQVSQGYAGDTEETKRKLQYDLYYVKHYSLIMDLKVLIRTVYVVLTGFGSR